MAGMCNEFNLYIADLNEKFRGRDIGGIGIDKQRIWNLAVIDVILLVKNRKALQDMIESFRRFLEEKKLELCINKTIRYWYVIGEEERKWKYENGVKRR